MGQEDMEPGGKPNITETEKTVEIPEVATEVAPIVAPEEVEQKENVSERLREATKCLNAVAKLLENSYVFLDPDTIAWRIQSINGRQVPELLFDDRDMNGLVDAQIPETKVKCDEYLDKIYALFQEEEKELREAERLNKIDCGPRLTDIETAFASYASYFDLKHLHNTIKTIDEALQNSEREGAKQFLLAIFTQIQKLREETNITEEQFRTVYREYQEVYRTLGHITQGVVEWNTPDKK